MTQAAGSKGQPLLALLAVLAGWIGGRATQWEAPASIQETAAGQRQQDGLAMGFMADGQSGPQSLPYVLSNSVPPIYPASSGLVNIPSLTALHRAGGAAVGADRTAADREQPLSGAFPPQPLWHPAAFAWGPSATAFIPRSAMLDTPHDAGARRESYFSVPEQGQVSQSGKEPSAVPPPPAERVRFKRWSADAWALFRHDLGAARSRGALPAVYGASQVGAVLRYRLNTLHGHRPAVYLRGTSAIGTGSETSVALGLSARPLVSLPVVAAVEGRATDEGGTGGIHPAVLAYSEVPPLRLPFGLRAEVYAQGGYAGGRYATPFADGQFRLDHRVLRFGRAEGRLGGGLWAGAQKGASRLDIGPGAFIAVPLGRNVFSRVAFDWRFRIAGRAAPGSGPAVTLSAGF